MRREAITQEQADERVALVERRQATLLRSPTPLLFAVLDEGCALRPMGGPGVMAAQFDRLLEFAEQPNTVLQIAPFQMGERRPFSLPVTVLTLPDRSLMAYAESTQHGHLESNNALVLPLLSAYHQLQAEALSQAASVHGIVPVRDSKNVTGPALTVPAAAFSAFVAGVRGGDLGTVWAARVGRAKPHHAGTVGLAVAARSPLPGPRSLLSSTALEVLRSPRGAYDRPGHTPPREHPPCPISSSATPNSPHSPPPTGPGSPTRR